MAQTALTQLQQQIEAVRREAFAAGYAAAMQAIREFTSKPAAGAETPSAPAQRRGRARRAATAAAAAAAQPSTQRQTRPARTARRGGQRGGRASGRRPQRGTNARLVEEVLQSMAPRAVRPAEIRAALQRDKGVAMAFTSIRHALGQLEARQTAEQVGNSKTWRHRGGGVAAAASN
jgi:hypothetical protein